MKELGLFPLHLKGHAMNMLLRKQGTTNQSMHTKCLRLLTTQIKKMAM